MAQVLESAGETLNKTLQKNNISNTSTTLEHRDLTLQDVAPLWSVKLGIIGKKDCTKLDILESRFTNFLDIGDYACCIVGEAHGLTANYTMKYFPEYCETCTRYAAALGVFGVPGRNTEKVIRMSRQFMDHFNQAHKEEWYAKYVNGTSFRL